MIQPASGILLIADPFLKDPNFLRTVILLCEHKEEGSLGFVLNRQYKNTLSELVPELNLHNVPLYYGGPVQQDSIHFLHQYPDEISGSMQVSPGIYWGGDFEAVVQLLKSDLADPDKIRFYLGYSGWGEGQLKCEMQEKTWLTLQGNSKIIFHENDNEAWKESLRMLGGDYKMMVNFPIDPQLN